MSVTPDGWVDWAERVPGDRRKQNGGANTVQGFVAHSAEGWEDYLRKYNTNQAQYSSRNASWTFSNLLDGTLLQHFSIYAQVWASGAGHPNNNFVPMEHEGIVGQTLTPAQVQTTARVISELAAVGGWVPERGVTLWEHREMTRYGAAATACPSDRIPWADVLTLLNPPASTQQSRGRDMLIIGLANGSAYLVVGKEIHWIPNSDIYTDLEQAIYSDKPTEIDQATWEWLDTIGVKRAS